MTSRFWRRHAAIFVIASLVWLVPPANACVNDPSEVILSDIESAVSRATAVFLGKVLSKENVDEHTVRVLIQVEEKWKGELVGEVALMDVEIGIICIPPLSVGSDYLFFPELADDGQLWSLGRVIYERQFAEALSFLREAGLQ